MKDFKVVSLPGGEQHVTYIGPPLVPGEKKLIRVEGVVTSDKIVALSMALDILYRNKVLDVTVFLPYLPGARQDRVQDKLVGFDASVYAGLICSQRLSSLRIVCLDPHSRAALTAYGTWGLYVKTIPHQDWFLPWIESTTFAPGPHKFLFPDKGAAEKYGKVAAYSPAMSCTKNRDPNTGKIAGFSVPDIRHFAEDQFLWIVDDICDGGATFIQIAEEVRRQLGNKVKLGLAVSHGLFSNNDNNAKMDRLFDYIVTTDSVIQVVTTGKDGDILLFDRRLKPSKLQIQPLQPILKKWFDSHAQWPLIG